QRQPVREAVHPRGRGGQQIQLGHRFRSFRVARGCSGCARPISGRPPRRGGYRQVPYCRPARSHASQIWAGTRLRDEADLRWSPPVDSPSPQVYSGRTRSTGDDPMLVYLNGEYIDHSEAKVSVDDRGFLFADGVYEVVRVYDGRPFLMEPHVVRMKEGLRALQIDTSCIQDLEQVAERILRENGLTDGDATIYAQVSRGVEPRKHA